MVIRMLLRSCVRAAPSGRHDLRVARVVDTSLTYARVRARGRAIVTVEEVFVKRADTKGEDSGDEGSQSRSAVGLGRAGGRAVTYEGLGAEEREEEEGRSTVSSKQTGTC